MKIKADIKVWEKLIGAEMIYFFKDRYGQVMVFDVSHMKIWQIENVIDELALDALMDVRVRLHEEKQYMICGRLY